MSEIVLNDWATLPSKRELLNRVERLPLSADAKLTLSKLLATTADVGGRIIEVGRRILAFIFETVKCFPNTAFGIVVALTISVLIGSVPVIGAALASFLGPLLVAFGVSKGALIDVEHGALRQRIDKLEAELRTVTA